MYHKLPCSLQGLVYIIPPRLAWACIRHTPSLHPRFTPTAPFPFTTPLCHPFFAAPSVQDGLVCFSSKQILPEKQVHNLVSLKSKTKLMIKGNISSFLTAPGSEFPRGRHFQRAARGLFHLLDLHFTPQASSSTGVFHVGPSMPNDNLPPLCEVVATVQREQAWKQQVRRKKAGRALRLEGTHLNPCHQTPNASSDEGGKEKKRKKKDILHARSTASASQHSSAAIWLTSPTDPRPFHGILQSTDPQTHGTPIPNAEQERSQLHKINAWLQWCSVNLHWL